MLLSWLYLSTGILLYRAELIVVIRRNQQNRNDAA